MNPTNSYPAAQTSEAFTPDRLLLGGHVISRKVTIDTGELTAEESALKIIHYLESEGFIPPTGTESGS